MRFALQFLALTAPERRTFLPYTFDGSITLDNGYLIECEDPMHLMLFYLQDHIRLPEQWENDPEFTFLSLAPREQVAQAIGLIDDLQARLQTLTWRELQTNASECQERAAAVLMLLGWPRPISEALATEILDEYTYGGFSALARRGS